MSCLFNSLSYFVPNIKSIDLRHTICEYLKYNPKLLDDIDAKDVIDWENGCDLNTYISNMENPSTWGGAIEIKCFCDIFNIKVIVHFVDRQIEFVPKNNKTTWVVELDYTGGHYEPRK